MKNHAGKARLLLIVLVLLVLGGAAVYIFNAEGEPPLIEVQPEPGFINAQTEIQVIVQDQKSGLAEVETRVLQGDSSRELGAKELGPNIKQWQDSFTLQGQGLRDQELTIQVRARDRSWAHLFQGNQHQVSRQYKLDTRSPEISLQTFVHNLNQGGSGAVGFTLSEPVSRAGVMVQETFFPAYKVHEDNYLCFFSFPYFLQPGEAKPLILAQDQAGNRKRSGFNLHINSRSFPSSDINVSEDFIQNTVLQFSDQYPQAESDLELFLAVNQDLRQENRQRLREISRETAKDPLWSGRFLRQPNSSLMSGFGHKRTYFYQGQEVDHKTHQGMDLASISRAKVPAANSGRVVFAGRLGIYGQTVILDHGLGLQSMYAHLSQILVQKGDKLQKKEVLGRTGATGLAAGDHLHFEIMISGVSVNPVEWWDPSWIENNVQPKLGLIAE
jgi:murein DD-endopeptidase MepM/ murein hydrolase activator NlpD